MTEGGAVIPKWVMPVLATAAVALLGWIVNDLNILRKDVGDILERLARLEGLFEGFIKRETVQ